MIGPRLAQRLTEGRDLNGLPGQARCWVRENREGKEAGVLLVEDARGGQLVEKRFEGSCQSRSVARKAEK